MNIASKFADFIAEPKRTWVFTSATLMVDNGFEHFQRQMGLDSAQDTLALDSPFDYQQQAMLCVPRFLPEPNARDMRDTLLDISIKLVKASGGRCFLLFTSHATLQGDCRDVRRQNRQSQSWCKAAPRNGPCWTSTCSTKNAVLLGTGAFWEGVDVRGDDLTCVLIDKLTLCLPG